MDAAHTTPTRFVNLDAARRDHGARVDRLGAALWRTDPLADALVAWIAEQPGPRGWAAFEHAAAHGIDSLDEPADPLRAFFRATEHVPLWLEREVTRRGGDVLFRGGVFSGLVLALGSLVYGYTAPAGNKPLILSGRLTARAARRLNETARFVHAVCLPGGLHRGAEGYRIALKVRLMHAQVRRLILDSGQWQAADWGAPINQHDMVATNQLFSTVLLEGLSRLGLDIEDAEAERYMMLWRRVGELSGVEPELLPSTWRQGKNLSELILATQAPPDDDSRALVEALMQAGPRSACDDAERRRMERRMPLVRGLCRGLIGDEMANQLALPDDVWKLSVPTIRTVVGRAETVRKLMPGGYELAVRAGRRHWARTVEIGLAGVPATFELPTRLANTAGDAATPRTRAPRPRSARKVTT